MDILHTRHLKPHKGGEETLSVTSGFFNSLNGDRKYNAEQMSSIFDGIINDGVFANIGTAFQVKAGSGNSVTVGIGRCWFNSTWLLNDSILTLALDNAELLLNRYDAIVFEMDHSDSVRSGSIKVVKGTAASDPKKPTMINELLKHQHPIAFVYRPAGSSGISQANITNVVGTSDCPYITGILKTVSIDSLIAQWKGQWDDWFSGCDAWQNERKGDFDAWFENLKIVLSDETASKLAVRYLELKEMFLKTTNVIRVSLSTSNWNGDSPPYTQSVKAEEVSGNCDYDIVSLIDKSFSKTQASQYKRAFGIISSGFGESSDGEVTFNVYDKPATDLEIGLKCGFIKTSLNEAILDSASNPIVDNSGEKIYERGGLSL